MPTHPDAAAPRVLLTRPRPQADRFAAALRAAHPGLAITIAPLLKIVPLALPHDAAMGAKGLIFTSENGVACYAAGSARRDLPVWCVGPRTAQAAHEAGFGTVHQAGGDAVALIAALRRARPEGPLVHLHGRHMARDIARALRDAGLEARDHEIYDQRARGLDPAARAALGTPGALVVPLFSPRSARLLVAALAGVKVAATLHPVAISAAAAAAFAPPGAPKALISATPDAEAMARAVSARIRALEAGVSAR